jgi:hypothetical protein
VAPDGPDCDGRGRQDHAEDAFKEYEPGFIHIDIKYLPQMPDETSRRYLFVAMDRATRWVFMRIYGDIPEASSVDSCVGSSWLRPSGSAISSPTTARNLPTISPPKTKIPAAGTPSTSLSQPYLPTIDWCLRATRKLTTWSSASTATSTNCRRRPSLTAVPTCRSR